MTEQTGSYASLQDLWRTLQPQSFLPKCVPRQKQNPRVRGGRQPVFGKCLVQKDTVPKLRFALDEGK